MEGHNMNDEIKNIELADRDKDVAMGEVLFGFFQRRFPVGERIVIDDSKHKERIGKEYTVVSLSKEGVFRCSDDNGNTEYIDPYSNTFYKKNHAPLIGHRNGNEDGVILNNVKEVADFIMKNGCFGEVVINTADTNEFMLSTFGIFLNRVADMDYRTELLAVLIPMQKKYEVGLMGYGEQDDSENIDEEESEDLEPIMQ
jgi:hypothetical protein